MGTDGAGVSAVRTRCGAAPPVPPGRTVPTVADGDRSVAGVGVGRAPDLDHRARLQLLVQPYRVRAAQADPSGRDVVVPGAFVAGGSATKFVVPSAARRPITQATFCKSLPANKDSVLTLSFVTTIIRPVAVG